MNRKLLLALVLFVPNPAHAECAHVEFAELNSYSKEELANRLCFTRIFVNLNSDCGAEAQRMERLLPKFGVDPKIGKDELCDLAKKR